MSSIKDMTKGKPTKLLLSFALPLMLGNIFQQMYSMVDTIVVGRGVGVEALASVGAAGWLDWLVLGIIMGLTQGFAIKMSQRFGAEDIKGLRKSIAMSVYLSIIIVVIFTALSLLLTRPLLEMLNTPENTIDGAQLYISIIFSGIVIIVSYNLLSSILRALGDSKSPLYAMILASIVNIVLDILFVVVFHMGVAGVAIATLIAQVCSCLFCLNVIRKISLLQMEKEDWRIDGSMIRQLLKLGTPIALQNGIIASGGLVVQYIVNGFGFIFVAGIVAAQKLCGLMEMAGTSLGAAVATFAGQNLGAGKYGRIQEGVRSAVKIAALLSVSIAAVVITFGRFLVRLFINGKPEEVDSVVEVAYPYLIVMGCLLIVLYMLFIYRSSLQGMGDTLIPMVSGIIELIMRVCMVLILPEIMGKTGVYFAEVSAWVGAAILLSAAYYIRMHKMMLKNKEGG